RREWSRASRRSQFLPRLSCPVAGQAQPGWCVQHLSTIHGHGAGGARCGFPPPGRRCAGEVPHSQISRYTSGVSSNPWIIAPKLLPLVGGEYGPYREGMQDEERAVGGR